MIQESFAILKRNLNIILNAKLSFLIIFLGPIILMLVAGAILQDTSLKSLDIGLYTANSNDLWEDEFLHGFQENLIDGGANLFPENSLSTCKDKVLKMDYNACVEIKKSEEYVPLPDSNIGSLNMPSYEFITHVDYSQTASAWKIISAIQKAADAKYAEMTQERITAMIEKIDGIISQLQAQGSSISDAKIELENIQTDLQNTSGGLIAIQNRISLIRQDIETVRLRLSEIDAAYPEGVTMTNQIRSNLLVIESNLNEISNLEAINAGGITSAFQRMQGLETSLAEMQSNIDTTVSDWNQLKQTELSQISNPVVYKSQSLSGSAAYNVEELGFIDYLFPTFLMFFIIFTCLIFPTNLIIRERISNSQIRNMTSKTSGLKFGINNFISCILVIIMQVFILLWISQYFLNADVFFRVASIATIVVIAVCTLSLLGMALGYLFNKFEGAIIASVSVSIIMLILLPGITPTSLLPKQIAPAIKNFLPVILENKLRTLIIFGAPLSFSFIEIISIIATSAVFLFVIVMLYQRSKREI